MVCDSVACLPHSSAPLSPSPFILEPIVDHAFPLLGLEASPAMNLVLVVQDSRKVAAKNNGSMK